MIAHTFQEACSAQWINANLKNLTHDLVLLRRLIPWQPIIDRLTPFYHPDKGRNGQSLRTTVAVSIVARLRQLSDEKVIEQIKENRYMQRSEEHTSELQSQSNLVCRLLLEKKKDNK